MEGETEVKVDPVVTTFKKLEPGDKFHWTKSSGENIGVSDGHKIKCKKLSLHHNLCLTSRDSGNVLRSALWTPLKGDYAGELFTSDAYQDYDVTRA